MLRAQLLSSRRFARWLSIQRVATPNPNALKFVPAGEAVLFLRPSTDSGPAPAAAEFASGQHTHHSPLAQQLFDIEGVRLVMIGDLFVTVNKDEETVWPLIQDAISRAVEEYAAGRAGPAVQPEFYGEAAEHDDSEVVAMIKELIETRIRPAVQDDGGDIEFRGFDPDTGVVQVKLQGACKLCLMLEDTLKSGIELMLMHYIDEVQTVEQVLDPEEQVGMSEFERLERQLLAKHAAA